MGEGVVEISQESGAVIKRQITGTQTVTLAVNADSDGCAWKMIRVWMKQVLKIDYLWGITEAEETRMTPQDFEVGNEVMPFIETERIGEASQKIMSSLCIC